MMFRATVSGINTGIRPEVPVGVRHYEETPPMTPEQFAAIMEMLAPIRQLAEMQLAMIADEQARRAAYEAEQAAELERERRRQEDTSKKTGE